jgi:DNA-binding SARP family transcriptional activator
VAKLRKALTRSDEGGQQVETVRPGYRLNVDPSRLDLLEFNAIAVEAREAMASGELDLASRLFAGALGLPRGALLADLADEEFVFQEAQAYERTLMSVTTDAYDCEVQRGRHVEVLGDLERLSAENPLDERLCSLLMVALYRSGRQVEALATYRRLRKTLADELGIEPGPEIQDLELQVLNHDPVLTIRQPRRQIDESPPTVTRSSRLASAAYLDLEGERIVLSRIVTTIGRWPDRTVVVKDSDASRQHAEIRRTTDGFVLVDMGSTNGTSVNGQMVGTHLLAPGDEIEIGETILKFHDKTPGKRKTSAK